MTNTAGNAAAGNGGGPRVVLRAGREKSLLRRHPWVFSGAVRSVAGDPGRGDTVDIVAADGAFVARGAYSPRSQIRARVWTFDPAENVDDAFFRERIRSALARRDALLGAQARQACRLINAESDGLLGVVADRYGDFIVCQFLAAGAERWKGAIAASLGELAAPRGIHERSDADVRLKEGLAPVKGRLAGEEPPELIEIAEQGRRYLVDVRGGHKTGFYLDQRENRAAFAERAAGKTVLNCFAYTGGFGVAALAAGAARVVNVDSSQPSLALAARNVELNGLDPARCENVAGDAFEVLRAFAAGGRTFDLIALDPPKFADSRAHLPKACRAYKDINMQAFKVLGRGGMLFTFSCSGLLAPDLFQKIVADAALDAGRCAQIVARLGQAADHPAALAFPEGTYLKGLVAAECGDNKPASGWKSGTQERGATRIPG